MDTINNILSYFWYYNTSQNTTSKETELKSLDLKLKKPDAYKNVNTSEIQINKINQTSQNTN